MIAWILSLALGAVGAMASYFRVGAMTPTTRIAAGLRFAAVALLGALAFNAPFGFGREPVPIAALDASASWGRGGDTARYAQARRAASDAARDSVLVFGDSIRRLDASAQPGDGATRIRPLVERAIGTGRPLLVFTDGELDDPEALASLPAGSRVEVIAATAGRDAAIADVQTASVAADGDTIEVRVTVTSGSAGAGAGRVTVFMDGRPVGSVSVDSADAFNERVVSVRVPVNATVAGDREVRAVYSGSGDTQAGNDTAATAISIGGSTTAVMISTAPDLDARELASLLRGAAAFPARVYYRVAPGEWRDDAQMRPVREDVVRSAMQTAPLVILHGDTAVFGAPRERSRGALALIVPPGPGAGEWFATGAPASPVSQQLIGTPWDSLPPLEVSEGIPAGEFEVLETRRARRLERRVAMTGWSSPRRVLVVGASGFWRWRFRGGAGVEVFTAVWGSALDWLAGQRSDVRAAVPELPAIRSGEPVRWRRGTGTDSLVPAVLSRLGSSERDTLQIRFGASGSVETPTLSPGAWEVQTAGGKSLLVVNASRELLPRRPSVATGDYGSGVAARLFPRARDFSWLFALAIAAICVEWVIRRRTGLR